jgi:ubiquinone/menaquinone biosynthesis C-methylase UbiE
MTGSRGPEPGFDGVAARYDDLRGGLTRGRQAAEALLPHLAPGWVLDVGAGTGVVAVALAERGHRVLGLDMSARMLEQAAARLPGLLVRADAVALPVASDSLANVVFVSVLQLVADMNAAIAEAARVLRPGGRLVAIHGEPVADPDELVDVLALLAPLRPERPDTPEALDQAGDAAGLRPVAGQVAAAYEQATSPAALADSLEARIPPYLWNVDETAWRELVEPAVARLRALPDPDRPRPQVWRLHLTAMVKG